MPTDPDTTDTTDTTATPPTPDTQPEQPPAEMEEKKEPTAKVSFVPPKGLVIPESASQTGEFDAVSTYRVEDGKLCLVKIGDTPMEGYDGGKENKENNAAKTVPPSFSNMIGGIMADKQTG